MMIEVDDIDTLMADQSTSVALAAKLRAQSTKAGKETMNMSAYGRSNVNSIVANARKELETLQRSELPVSRMSANDVARKAGTNALESAKKSLTSLNSNPTGKIKGMNIPSVKSLQSLPSNNDYIAVYKNDEER